MRFLRLTLLSLIMLLARPSVWAEDTPRPMPDTAFLPYTLQTELLEDHEGKSRAVNRMMRVLQARLKPEDSIVAVDVVNGGYYQDDAASVFISFLPKGTPLSQDPVFLTITDYCIFADPHHDTIGIGCVGYRGDTAFFVRNYPGSNTFDWLFLATGKDETGDGRWRPGLHHALTDDYDYDGTPELFFYMTSGRDKLPRELLCIDPVQLRLEWSVPMASSVVGGNVVSCHDSANPGVLVCTYGPENFVTDANFDDRFGYFSRIDGYGRIVFNYCLAPRFQGPAVLVHPQESLFVLAHPWPLPSQRLFDTTHAWLSLVRADGTAAKSIELDDLVASMSFQQCDADSALELLTVDPVGRIRIFNQSLELKRSYGRSRLAACLGQFRIAGQRDPVFAFASVDGLVLCNREFEYLAVYPVQPSDCQPASFDAMGNVTSIVVNTANGCYVARISKQPRFHAVTVMFWRFRNWLVLLLGTVTLALFFVNHRWRMALRRAQALEARNKALLNASPDLMFRMSRDGVFLDYQAGREQELYTPGEQFIGRTISEVMPAGFAEQVLSLIQHTLQTGDTQLMEYQLPIHGTRNDFEARIVPISSREVLAVVRNITEQKARQALVERQARILAEVQDVIVVTDTSNIVTEWNRGAEQLSGYSAEEIVGQHASVLFDAEDWAEIEATRLVALRQGQSYSGEVRARAKDGRHLLLQLSVSVMHDSSGKAVSYISYGTDITARHQAEQALRESEAKYRALTENTNIGILLYDSERVLFANRRAAEILETTVQDLESCSLSELLTPTVGPDEAAFMIQQGQARLRGQNVPSRYERTIRTRAGRKRVVEIEASRIALGNTSVNQTSLLDITDRRAAEQALRESEERHRNLFENTPLGIYRTTPGGRILLANPALLAMLGFPSLEALQARNLLDEGFEPSYPRRQFIEHIEADGEIRGLEAAWITARGSTIFVRENAHVVRDEQGRTLYYDGMVEDITDRVLAIRALLESEEKYRTLAEHANLGILLYDDERILFANAQLAEVLDTTVEHLAGMPTAELIAIISGADQVNDWMQQIRTRLAGEPISPRFEATVTTFQGNRKRLEALATPITLFDRTVIQATWLDITARYQAQQALQESEEKYRTLAEHSNLGILLYDDQQVYYANECLARLLDISVERLTGMSTVDLIATIAGPDMVDKWLGRIRSHLTGQMGSSRFETDVATFQGARKRLEALATPISLFGRTVVQATWLDISDRYRAEQALRESEERYRTLAEYSGQGILLLDRDQIIFVNRRFAGILESSVEYLTGKSILQMIEETSDPSETAYWFDVIQDRIEGRETPTSAEINIRTYQGHYRRVEVIVTDVLLKGKSITQATWLDITDRYHAEQALRESEAKFRAVAESMTAAITIFGQDRLLYCNPASEQITGFSVEELLQKNFWDIIHPDFRDLVIKRGLQRLEGKKTPPRYEVKILTKSGDERWVDYAAQVVEFVGQPAVLGTAIDITERKKAETRVARLYQERYEQVKEIAGGVSHEIYNALFPATTTLYALRERLQKEATTPADLPRNLRLIELAEQAIDRAIHMTETVTRFARVESDRRADPIPLCEMVEDVRQQLGQRIADLGVTVAVSIPRDLVVLCNRAHGFSIFTNLMANALDAIAESPRRSISITAVRCNQHARIQFCDSGTGIPPENLPRIFNAFFSTKPASGTGLGLAIVKRLVELYDGQITVDSRLDEGTTFTILLPSPGKTRELTRAHES